MAVLPICAQGMICPAFSSLRQKLNNLLNIGDIETRVDKFIVHDLPDKFPGTQRRASRPVLQMVSKQVVLQRTASTGAVVYKN